MGVGKTAKFLTSGCFADDLIAVFNRLLGGVVAWKIEGCTLLTVFKAT